MLNETKGASIRGTKEQAKQRSLHVKLLQVPVNMEVQTWQVK